MDKIDDYDIDYPSPLGEGAFGSVYSGKHKTEGVTVALKRMTIKKSNPDLKLLQDVVKQEIETIKSIKGHPNIVDFIAFTEESKPQNVLIWIITEFCSLGDLSNYSIDYYLTTGNHLVIMEQIASGLAYLHGHDPILLHGAIKPGNILVTLEDGRHVTKLGDCGISCFIKSIRSNENYEAPELLDEEKRCVKEDQDKTNGVHLHRTGAIDVFAAGLVFYQLINAEPGQGISCKEIIDIGISKTLLGKTRKGWDPIKSDEHDSKLIADVKSLIREMVRFDPRDRITMDDVLKKVAAFRDIIPVNGPPGNGPPEKPAEETVHPPELKMKHILTRNLPFQASYHIYFGSNAVLLEVSDQLQKMNLVKDDDAAATPKTYKKDWKKDWPEGVKAESSRKFILPGGHIVMRYQNKSPTTVWDSELNLILHRFDTDCGHLSGVVQGDKLLYAKKTGDQYQLDLYHRDDHRHVCTLPSSVVSSWLASSSHPSSGSFIITDHRKQSMDVFSPDYEHQRRVKLGFQPWWNNGVVCVKDIIAVAEHKNLHIYNWSGEKVGTLAWGRLTRRSEVLGIGDEEQGRIQVATGRNGEVEALHVYQIS